MSYTRNNYEEHALDYLEGTMTREQRERFEHFLVANPDIYNEVAEMKLIYLTPDLSVQFPGKERLHKNESKRRSIRLWYSVAAALILFISFIFLLYPHRSEKPTELVNNNLVKELPAEDSPSDKTIAPTEELGEEGEDLKNLVVEVDKVQPSKSNLESNPEAGDLEEEHITRNLAGIDPPVEATFQEEAISHTGQGPPPDITDRTENKEIPKLTRSLASVSIPVLDQLPRAGLSEIISEYEIGFDEELVTVSEAEIGRERSIVGRLLANINLIPDGLRDLDKDELREKVMPEFIASRD